MSRETMPSVSRSPRPALALAAPWTTSVRPRRISRFGVYVGFFAAMRRIVMTGRNYGVRTLAFVLAPPLGVTGALMQRLLAAACP